MSPTPEQLASAREEAERLLGLGYDDAPLSRSFRIVTTLILEFREAKERIASLEGAEQRMREKAEEEKVWRELLWIRHGCSMDALYGDDGEMQCGKCVIDFRRDTPEQIRERWRDANTRALIAAQKELAAAIHNIPLEGK